MRTRSPLIHRLLEERAAAQGGYLMHGDLTAIARLTGTTKVNVHNIMRRKGLRLVRFHDAVRCQNCGNLLRRYRPGGRKFCNHRCRLEYQINRGTVICRTCIVCKRTFVRPRSVTRYLFCSKSCWGSYFGTHFGKGTNPLERTINRLRYRWLVRRAR